MKSDEGSDRRNDSDVVISGMHSLFKLKDMHSLFKLTDMHSLFKLTGIDKLFLKS